MKLNVLWFFKTSKSTHTTIWSHITENLNLQQNCALLGYYTASSGNFLPTFQDNLLVLSTVYWTVHHCNSWWKEIPTWCHLLFYFTYYALNMFRTLVVLQPAKRTPPNTSHNKSSNTQRTENKTTDVVIHQRSRKLLKMDILMSETCWAHNKWNKIASDIRLVFHSSTIAMMHGPINSR